MAFIQVTQTFDYCQYFVADQTSICAEKSGWADREDCKSNFLFESYPVAHIEIYLIKIGNRIAA